MRLSEVNDLVSIDVLRDGEFHSLGVLSHDSDKMLVVLYDADYLDELLANDHITCVLTSRDLAERLPENLAVAACDDPVAAFYEIHSRLLHETDFYWEGFDSEVSSHATVHERAYVAPRNVRIGRGSIVEPNATILERSILGEEVIVRAGAVIGGEGFEPKSLGKEHLIIVHAGGVCLRDRVEIQASSHIQRAVFGGFTEVGEATKVGPLVDIGHHVRIGRRCEIAACAKVCGSTTIGDDVWIGPNATVSSELRIGNNAYITLGSVVTRNVPDGHRVTGNFAVDHSRFITFIKSIR